MNICTILLILTACLFGTYASKVAFKPPVKFSQKAKAVGEKCVKEEGAPADFMEKLFPWNYPKTEAHVNAMFCYVKTIGLTDENGIYIPEKVIPVFSNSDKFEEIKVAFVECKGLRGKSPQETAFLVAECFFDKAPIRLIM